MRSLLFGFIAFVLALPACSSRPGSTESESPPPTPIPIVDSSPTGIEEVAEIPPQPSITPPIQPTAPEPAIASEKDSSATETLDSITRVLNNAVEGKPKESGESSKGSIFGSISRALNKGFQEAVTPEQPLAE